MAHSYHKIWIHAIWATKKRLPLIDLEIESIVYKMIENRFIEKGCSLKIINGMPEHVHCLFQLHPNEAFTNVIKHVKGGTSFDINEKLLTKERFEWQTGYSAFSVSESMVAKTYQYIKNQKEHHSKLSFDLEYKEYLKKYGFNE